MKEKAFFVFRPRTTEDLHPMKSDGTLREYQIVKTIRLNRIDFENFSSDLLADRQFLEASAGLCTEKSDCLLITGKGHVEELLVIPRDCYVQYAALRSTVRIVYTSSVQGCFPV